MIEDDDTNVIFDAPKKKDTNGSTKSNNIKHCQNIDPKIISKDISYLKSLSQEIDSDSVPSESFDQLEPSATCSKIEEDSDVNLNECVGDVSYYFSLFFFSYVVQAIYTKALLLLHAKLYMKYIAVVYYKFR